jgi:4-azaleucine resistance transporter AzlC
MKYLTFKYALKTTIPILFGYGILSFSFGILAINLGFAWYIPILMSILIYSGALQFLLIGILTNHLTLIDIFTTSFLLNIRQIFYGLSFLEKFKKFKYYSIFALTDETFVLMHKIVPKNINESYYYFFISILNHFYWILGTILGVIFAKNINFHLKGLDFILTALFVVLLVQQYRKLKVLFPFVIGICSFVIIYTSGIKNILLYSILLSIVVLALYKKRIKNA